MKKGKIVASVNTKINNRAAINKERRELKLMKDHEKESKRKKVPRGTARAKRRRGLRTLYGQNTHREQSNL